MAVVAQQVAILAIFALVGFALARCGLIKVEHSKLLSTLEVYVCFPCTVFRTYSAYFTPERLAAKAESIVVSIVLLAVVTIFAKWISKRFSSNPYEQNVHAYSLIVPNTGYMGTALVESLYGQAILMDQMMFNLPLTFFTYTEGYRMLTGGKKMTLKKLINPVTIAMALGCIVGIFGIPMPSIVSSVVDKANGCMAPLSMILTGIAISEFKLLELLKNKMVYVTTALRLIALPLVAAFVASMFFDRAIVLAVVMQFAMPCGLNTIIFPKLVGENCETGAGLALVSNVVAIFTIPLCVAIFL